MAPEDLNRLRRQRPFVPFRIHVAGITHYDVTDADMMRVGRTSLFIGLRRDPAGPYFDEPVFVNLSDVTHATAIG